MAFPKFVNDRYENKDAIRNLVHYVLNRKKTPWGLIGAFGLNTNYIEEEMLYVKKFYGKTDKQQVYHLVISFSKGEIVPSLAYNLAWEIAQYFGSRFQVFFAVHEDHAEPHIHMVFNSVSFVDGKRFSDSYTFTLWKIRNIIDNFY